MNKKVVPEVLEEVMEFGSSAIPRAARLRREFKTGALRAQTKRRRVTTRGRRKSSPMGGIHLRGNKRTPR